MNVFPTENYNFSTNATAFGRFLRCFTNGLFIIAALMPLNIYGVYYLVYLQLINCFVYFQSGSHSHHSQPFNEITVNAGTKQQQQNKKHYSVWLIFYSPFLRSTHFTNDTWVILTGQNGTKSKTTTTEKWKQIIYYNFWFSLESVQVNAEHLQMSSDEREKEAPKNPTKKMEFISSHILNRTASSRAVFLTFPTLSLSLSHSH